MESKIKYSLSKIIDDYLIYCLLFLFTIIGFYTVDYYGIAWDEQAQIEIGEVSYSYVFYNDTYYPHFVNRDYGVIFELPLYLISRMFDLTDSRTIFLTRHIISHLFFLLGAFYFYRLIVVLYGNKLLASIGFLFIVLNPTIYGHSFFNTKDVPFLVMFIFCFYHFSISFRDKKYIQFLVLGLYAGMLINFRIMGILFFALVLFFLIVDIFINIRNSGILKKHLYLFILFLITSVFSTICFWPLLWHKPIDNFILAFQNMSKFRWDGEVLFKGKTINTQNLSWDYIITWFSINNPIVYLVFGIIGIVLFILNSIKKTTVKNYNLFIRNNLLFLFTFCLPILAVIILHSVVYDSWRQMFFVYPAFILFAIYLLNYLWQTKLKKISIGVTLSAFIFISAFTIANFPFHHVYFNQFVSLHKGEYIRKNYEMDYWSVSYNKALEYVLEIDHSAKIRISADNPTIIPNADMLFENQKKRIIFVDSIHKSDYFISTYRWHPQDYDSKNLEELKSFMVLNSKINTIFKVKK